MRFGGGSTGNSRRHPALRWLAAALFLVALARPALAASSAAPQAIVLVGGSGDLATRLLQPAFLQLEKNGRLPAGLQIVAVGRDAGMTDAGYRALVRSKIAELKVPHDPATLDALVNRLTFVSGAIDDRAVARQVRAKLAQVAPGARPTYYFAVPPKVVAGGVEALHDEHMLDDAKVVVEKPIGSDARTARQVNALLHKYLRPEQVFRMDHYLGKQGARDITSIQRDPRFAGVFDKAVVERVEMGAEEELGIGHRAGYYDGIGAGRDMLQSHLIQIAGLVLMGRPAGRGAGAFIDAKTQALKQLRAPRGASLAHAVRGQYDGYQAEDGVAPGSTTETFAAVRLTSRDPRWAGVPIVMLSGKQLGAKQGYAKLFLRATPAPLARAAGITPGTPAEVVIEMDPKPRVTVAGREIAIQRTGDANLSAYASQLDAVLRGDHAAFPGEHDSAEGWRIMGGVLRGWQRAGAQGLVTYKAGQALALSRLRRPVPTARPAWSAPHAPTRPPAMHTRPTTSAPSRPASRPHAPWRDPRPSLATSRAAASHAATSSHAPR